jgi:hypothetical protein
MITPDPGDPEAVLAYLSDPIQAIWIALDDGVSFADTTLTQLRSDAWMWAHLVRYRAAALLEKSTDSSWRFCWKRHSGIEVAKGPFVMRAFKTQEGGPPAPGRNRARRQFWTQPRQLAFPIWGDVLEIQEGANLILDWTATDEREVLLALSRPAGIWDYKADPILEWRRPIEFDLDNEPSFVGGGEEDVDVYVELDLDEIDAEGDAG